MGDCILINIVLTTRAICYDGLGAAVSNSLTHSRGGFPVLTGNMVKKHATRICIVNLSGEKYAVKERQLVLMLYCR